MVIGIPVRGHTVIGCEIGGQRFWRASSLFLAPAIFEFFQYLDVHAMMSAAQ